MEIRAYNKLYLDDAMESLAVMLDYAVNFYGWELDEFFLKFPNTDRLVGLFEQGDPNTVSGWSGVDLYFRVLGDLQSSRKEYISYDRSPEYWVGWTLAYCQWKMNRNFRFLFSLARPSELISWYPIYHEMDLQHVVDALKERQKKFPTSLELRRKQLGLSQTQLSRISSVSLRTIQRYEQHQDDLDKAQFNILYALSTKLHCTVYDLVADDMPASAWNRKRFNPISE